MLRRNLYRLFWSLAAIVTALNTVRWGMRRDWVSAAFFLIITVAFILVVIFGKLYRNEPPTP